MMRLLALALLLPVVACAGGTEQVVDGVTAGLETINRSSFRAGERMVCDLPRMSVLMDELANDRLVKWAGFCGYEQRFRSAFAVGAP